MIADPIRLPATLPPVPDDLPGWEWEADRYTNGAVVRLACPAEGEATDWQPPFYAEAMIGYARAMVARDAAVVAEVRAERGTQRTDAIRDLAPAVIRRDGGTQARTGNNEEVVEEYASAMREGRWQWHDGNRLIVFGDDAALWLADGFHRIEAAQRANLPTVPCEVRPGSRRDAVLYAVGANSSHGLQRTRQDVRRAIELLLRDEEWGKWSHVELARRVGCSDKTVGTVKRALMLSSEIPMIAGHTVARNGTTYTQAARQPAAPATRANGAPAAPAEPAPPAAPAAPAAPEPHPDPTNAPLTDDELLDLSLLGGYEFDRESFSPLGTRRIWMTDTRHPDGWTPEMRSAAAWRHRLGVLRPNDTENRAHATATRATIAALARHAEPAPDDADAPLTPDAAQIAAHPAVPTDSRAAIRADLDAIDARIAAGCAGPDDLPALHALVARLGALGGAPDVDLDEQLFFTRHGLQPFLAPWQMSNAERVVHRAAPPLDLATGDALKARGFTYRGSFLTWPEHPLGANVRQHVLFGTTTPDAAPTEQHWTDDGVQTLIATLPVLATRGGAPTAPAFDACAAARQAMADELHAASPRLVRLLLLALCFSDIPDEDDTDVLRETLTDGLAGCDDAALVWALGTAAEE